MPPNAVSNSRRLSDITTESDASISSLPTPDSDIPHPDAADQTHSGARLRDALIKCERARKATDESIALVSSANLRTEKRKATRVRYEAIRAERKRLISVRWQARQARYARLHPVAQLPPDHSRIGDPFDDVPIDAVFQGDRPGFDGPARLAAVRHPDLQAFVTQTLNDTIRRLLSMSLDAASALSISSEAPVRERLERLMSQANTTISSLGRAKVILDAGHNEVDLPD